MNLKHRTQPGLPTEGPLSSRALIELSLFSTCIFVFAALLMQFLLTLYTAFLLRLFSITFQYSLFAINFSSESGSMWSASQIYLVFGSGPILFSIVGLLLLALLKRIGMADWKTKLSLTWMAFLMVNALPCSIIAGVFFFEGFGMAFNWLTDSYIVRLVIAIIVLFILLFFSRFWSRLFLKASYSATFFDHGHSQKIFIKNVYFKPWIYGFFILMLYNWQFNNFFWRTFLVSLGYMAIALFDHKKRMHRKPHIMKSDKIIFTSRYQMVFIVIVLVLIWIADNFIIDFTMGA